MDNNDPLIIRGIPLEGTQIGCFGTEFQVFSQQGYMVDELSLDHFHRMLWHEKQRRLHASYLGLNKQSKAFDPSREFQDERIDEDNPIDNQQPID